MSHFHEKGNDEVNVVYLRPKKRRTPERRICNLCKQPYLPHSKFERFCTECKKSNELYHFHEWLSAS